MLCFWASVFLFDLWIVANSELSAGESIYSNTNHCASHKAVAQKMY